MANWAVGETVVVKFDVNGRRHETTGVVRMADKDGGMLAVWVCIYGSDVIQILVDPATGEQISFATE